MEEMGVRQAKCKHRRVEKGANNKMRKDWLETSSAVTRYLTIDNVLFFAIYQLSPKGEFFFVQNTKPQIVYPLFISVKYAPLTPPRVTVPNQTTHVPLSFLNCDPVVANPRRTGEPPGYPPSACSQNLYPQYRIRM